MCIVKTPKIKPGTDKPKEPTVIRNAYLDGVGPAAKAQRKGRSSLRISRSQPSAPPAHIAPRPGPAPIAQPGPSPVYGGGVSGGGLSGGGRGLELVRNHHAY